MYKIVIFIMLFAFSMNAQPKKPAGKNPKTKPKTDSLAVTAPSVAVIDTFDIKEEEIREQPRFAVYSKKAKVTKDRRMKLCFNLVNVDTTVYLFHCINDSICKDPEVYKILWRQIEGDSTYMLIYVDAVTKVEDKPSCDAGHETKLFFVRWNTVANKAIWKQKTVGSCIKAITNMRKEPIDKWDGSSPLVVNYYKGASIFTEVKFDPANYLLGLQSSDSEGK
jgi:hypothetical protein